MAQQLINVGAAPNDGTGDDLRSAFQKVNLNSIDFDERIAGLIGSITTENIFVAGNLTDQFFSGTDTADVISFTGLGTDVNSANGELTFRADGSILVNTPGLYIFVLKFQVQKLTNAGNMKWLSYTTAEFENVESIAGTPIFIELPDAKANMQKDLTRFINAPVAGLIFRSYQTADSQNGGSSDGGLSVFTPSIGGGPNGTTIQAVPSASIIVSKLV